MKSWLLLFLACLPLAAHAQDTWRIGCFPPRPVHVQDSWPRNAEGSVEFVGSLPWPGESQTDVQRWALVRHWYMQKLTSNKLSVSNELPQYYAPQWSDPWGRTMACQEGEGETKEYFWLSYKVELALNTTGLSCRLYHCTYGWGQEDDSVSPIIWDVENALNGTGLSPVQRENLAVFRNQIADALTHW